MKNMLKAHKLWPNSQTCQCWAGSRCDEMNLGLYLLLILIRVSMCLLDYSHVSFGLWGKF